MHAPSSLSLLVLALAGGLFCVACDDGSGDDMSTTSSTTGDGPSHDEVVQPIWDARCVEGCHEPGGEWPLQDLSPGMAYGAIVGEPASQADMNTVEPGDLDMSYLWHKINGTHADVGGSGVQMPKPRTGETFTPLSAADVATIEEWILGGAAP